jgi:serine phosphatase RsbU (regulator of sigma subunit)
MIDSPAGARAANPLDGRDGFMRLERAIRTLPRPAWMAIALGAVLGAFIADYLSGDEVSSSLFYVLAIGLGAWFVGRAAGVALALLSTGAWAVSYFMIGRLYSKSSVLYWNLITELAVYLITALTVASVQRGLDEERTLRLRLDRAHRALDAETRAVGALQRRLLPQGLPKVRGYEWSSHYVTSSRAGGDYFDFFELPDGRIGILVADATGHGAPAAVLMAMTRVLLHTSDEGLAPPEHVLSRLNQQLARALPSGWFVTACYAVLNPASGRLEYALAGHEPPHVLRAQSARAERLRVVGGPPLGPFAAASYAAGVTVLQPGDTLVVHTDGLTEAESPARELFGEERLSRVLEESSPISLTELRGRLLECLEAHRGGAPIRDDLTLLMLRRRENDRAQLARIELADRSPAA